MKYLFWLLALCACSNLEPSNQKTFYKDDPSIIRDNGIYKINQELLNGYLIDTFENGMVKSKMYLKNGKQEDTTFTFHINGSIREYRIYKNNKQDGIQKGYYIDGTPRFSYSISKDKFHGKIIEWHPNGKIAKKYNYINGFENGKQQAWDIDGRIYINCDYKNGRRYGLENPKPCYNIKNENVQN